MPKRKAIESSDSANKTSTEPKRVRQHGKHNHVGGHGYAYLATSW